MLKTKSLTPLARAVMLDKATERPFTGSYDDFNAPGSYLCRHCGHALYRASHKFHSGCGWPSFDEEIPHAVNRQLDEDGQRTELLCMYCNAHLGHEFIGEGYTPTNIRQCINSASLDYAYDAHVLIAEEAIFAGGCFWGVEHYFRQLPGVVQVEVGYIGGKLESPSYERVCQGDSGHYEAVRVLYDTQKLSFKDVCKYFLEIHNPFQADGQGPDLGSQYLSAIFYYHDAQKHIARNLLHILAEQEGQQPATKLLPISVFWPAEAYHQNYYSKKQQQPYCHRYTKRFA